MAAPPWLAVGWNLECQAVGVPGGADLAVKIERLAQ